MSSGAPTYPPSLAPNATATPGIIGNTWAANILSGNRQMLVNLINWRNQQMAYFYSTNPEQNPLTFQQRIGYLGTMAADVFVQATALTTFLCSVIASLAPAQAAAAQAATTAGRAAAALAAWDAACDAAQLPRLQMPPAGWTFTLNGDGTVTATQS